jgi:hypothetical protein
MSPHFSRIAPDAALLTAERRHSDLSDRINASGTSEDLCDRLLAEQVSTESVIAAARPETGDGLRAKARALQRLLCGGNVKRPTLPDSYDDDIGRLTWSLLQDILHQRAVVDLVAFEAALTGAGMEARS